MRRVGSISVRSVVTASMRKCSSTTPTTQAPTTTGELVAAGINSSPPQLDEPNDALVLPTSDRAAKREARFLASAADPGYVRARDVMPTDISQLTHRSPIGARLAQERQILGDKYGSNIAQLSKARAEMSVSNSIQEATEMDAIVGLVVSNARKSSPALYQEAATAMLRLSIQNRIPASSPAEIMAHLSSMTNTDHNSRWAVTPDEVLEHQRYLAVKASHSQNYGIGEDGGHVSRLVMTMIKYNIPPSVATLSDLALTDITFPMAYKLVEAFHRVMGADVALPTELLTRVLGLVSITHCEKALSLYTKAESDGLADSLRPAAHAHALAATRYLYIRNHNEREQISADVLADIAVHVRRIVKRVDMDKLSGEEGVYFLSNAVAALSNIGDWPHARVLLEKMSIPKASKDGDILDDAIGNDSAGDKEGTVAKKKKGDRLAMDAKLLIHTATTLVTAMSSAVQRNQLDYFVGLRMGFDNSGFSFADVEQYTLIQFFGRLTRQRLGGSALPFTWVERKLMADLIRVDEKDGVRHVTALTSRQVLEALSKLVGASATGPVAYQPSEYLWQMCLDLYTTANSLPILPSQSGLVSRSTALSASIRNLLTCFQTFKAPVSAVDDLAASIAKTYGVDSAEFGIFCSALLRTLNGNGSSCLVKYIRSPHHCVRLLAQVAVKAPQVPLQMAQCRRGAAQYLRIAVAQGAIGWERAMDLLLCHPLVSSQDPLPDPSAFLDIAIIASYGGASYVDKTTGAEVPLRDFVLFALALAPRSVLDHFIRVDGDDNISGDKKSSGYKRSKDEDYLAASAPIVVPGTIHAHLLDYLAAASGVPVEEGWVVFDNQKHRLRGLAIEFFLTWRWVPSQPIRDFYKDEPEDYFSFGIKKRAPRSVRKVEKEERITGSLLLQDAGLALSNHNESEGADDAEALVEELIASEAEKGEDSRWEDVVVGMAQSTDKTV